MKLDPDIWAALTGVLLFAIYVAAKDDMRWLRWVRRLCHKSGRWARDQWRKAVTARIQRNRNWRYLSRHRDTWAGQAHSSCRRGSTEAVP